MSFDLREFESLLFDWESATLDDQGVQRVREILRSNAEARDFYIQHQLLSAALSLDADSKLQPNSHDTFEAVASDAAPNLTAPNSTAPNRFFRVSLWAATAASLLFCGLVGRLTYMEFFQQTPQVVETHRVEETSAGVALVTRMVDVEFDKGAQAFEVGDALLPGRLSIESGFAQIEFFCGATLIVEGPAEIDLKSSSLAKFHSGKLRAQVPPAARGFSIEVEDMKVVDLGTEFALSVNSQGADIQVFDGEVELHDNDNSKQLLTAGQAVTRAPDGQLQQVKITPDRFVDIASMETRADGQRDARFHAWRQWSQDFRKDPRLIACYAFDDVGTWQRKLQSNLEPANTELDGAIVGAGRVDGRWPGKSGLEFKRPGDRVRVQIPGEFGSLTFACWVKIDSLDRWYNSLFLTDNYNEGEPHWQILDSGQLFFSVRHKPDEVNGQRTRGPTHKEVLSPPFWQPSMSGRWIHLATTYDSKLGKIAHYVNGGLIHEETIAAELLVTTTRIGAASICNWSIPTRPDAEFAVRNLNGSMDELMIFSAALGKNEIREIYENGKP